MITRRISVQRHWQWQKFAKSIHTYTYLYTAVGDDGVGITYKMLNDNHAEIKPYTRCIQQQMTR